MFSLVPLSTLATSSEAAPALEALSKVRDFEQVAISPDSTQVAWVELLYEAEGRRSRNAAIYCTSLNDSTAKPVRIAVTGVDAREHKLAWAPDSWQIAFISDAKKAGAPELYISDCHGQSARPLTSLSGYLDDPAGRRMAKILRSSLQKGPLLARIRSKPRRHVSENSRNTLPNKELPLLR